MQKTYFNWSTGKDSALALYHLLQDPDYSVEKLITSVNKDFDRVSMHGLRRSMMEKQLEALSIPSSTIELPENTSMEIYNQIMKDSVEELKSEGFTTAGFGDIFLEDLKQYRENQLDKVGMQTVFPLWKRDTKEIMQEFLDLGFKSIVVCCDNRNLNESFAGRIIDQDFLNDLPESVDPCGENGEFHTFCFDGPIFKQPIDFEIGEKIYREYPAPTDKDATIGFWFCDLIEK